MKNDLVIRNNIYIDYISAIFSNIQFFCEIQSLYILIKIQRDANYAV